MIAVEFPSLQFTMAAVATQLPVKQVDLSVYPWENPVSIAEVKWGSQKVEEPWMRDLQTKGVSGRAVDPRFSLGVSRRLGGCDG